MKHKYIIIDGEFGGTGIRDEFEGFIDLDEIPISKELRNKISKWAKDYPSHTTNNSLQSKNSISEFDLKGLELMNLISKELGKEFKIRYYSDIKTKELKVTGDGKILEI